MRARALDVRKVDAGLARETTCQGRDDRAASKPRRTVIALGRPDFAERLHFEWGVTAICRWLRPVHPLIPAHAGIQIFLLAALDPRCNLSLGRALRGPEGGSERSLLL